MVLLLLIPVFSVCCSSETTKSEETTGEATEETTEETSLARDSRQETKITHETCPSFQVQAAAEKFKISSGERDIL